MEASLTIEEIDDILDEIEQREPKHLLLHNDLKLIEIDDKTIDFSNVISLDVELGIPQNDSNSDSDKQQQLYDDFDYLIFDQKSLISGYFIVNLLKQYKLTPNEIMNNIIDLCILFTFYYDEEKDELIIMSDEETSASDISIDIDISINICNHDIHSTKNYIFGQAQSPINLITSPQSQFVSKLLNNNNQFINNPLKFNYPSFIKKCTIINNGHTVQININNDKCKLFINNRYYILNQFHFHIPSEHTIDNKQYEMEMHLVHINHKENKIAVLGFLFSTNNDITKYIKKPSLQLTKSKMHLILSKKKEYIDDDQEEKNKEIGKDEMKSNDFLDQFFDELPTEKTEDGDQVLLNDITFDYLFETSSNNFIKNVETNEIEIDMEIFEYMGSLSFASFLCYKICNLYIICIIYKI